MIEEVKADWCETIKRLSASSSIVSESIKSMCRTCDGNVKKVGKLTREISKHSIVLPQALEGRNLREDFDKVYEDICNRGRVSRIFKLLHRECEYIIKECRVDDATLNNIDQAVIIMLSFEVNDLIKDTARIWNNTVKSYGGPLVDESFQGIIQLEIPLGKLMRAIKEEKQYVENNCDIKKAI